MFTLCIHIKHTIITQPPHRQGEVCCDTTIQSYPILYYTILHYTMAQSHGLTKNLPTQTDDDDDDDDDDDKPTNQQINKPTKANQIPTKANNNQREPTTTNKSQQKPTTTNEPTEANKQTNQLPPSSSYINHNSLHTLYNNPHPQGEV